MVSFLVNSIATIASPIIDRLFPDTEAAQKAKHEFALELAKQETALQLAASANIKAEAASGHWLAANWRPITMLIFVGLVVARMFGFTAENISEQEYLKLWDIIMLGIGGYTVGRTVEKTVPNIVERFKK